MSVLSPTLENELSLLDNEKVVNICVNKIETCVKFSALLFWLIINAHCVIDELL